MMGYLMYPLILVLNLLPLISSSAILQERAPQSNCTSCAPNPIATVYPKIVTGIVNTTTSVVIVPLAYAKSLLPSHFVLLSHAYARFGIPAKRYPLIVESIIDHDIRYEDVNALADFSSFRLTFPFIDLLGDNSTCFKYTGYLYLPPTSPEAIAGTEAYGTPALPATFDPPNAAYKSTSPHSESISFSVYPNASETLKQPPAASVRFRPASASHSFPLAFYRNVTNQPIFGNNTVVCDKFIRFWNTTVTKGQYRPVNLQGDVKVSPPLVHEVTTWKNVQGVRATQAFLENNLVPCHNLAHYGGTGPGDSG